MSAFRLEIRNKIKDTVGLSRVKSLQSAGFDVQNLQVTDVYTVNKAFSEEEKTKIAEMLTNTVFEEYEIKENSPSVKGWQSKTDGVVSSSGLEKSTSPDKSGTPQEGNFLDFDYALEIGFLPGVTDNIGHTAKESIEDLLKIKFNIPVEAVYSSQISFIKGDLTKEDVQKIGESLANSLIQRINIKTKEEFKKDGGMDIVVPKVELDHEPGVDDVSLDISEEELIKLGKQGIENEDGTRRGPLALSLSYLNTIKNYFVKENRDPKDVELEALAQTWSEHCKHTIFASPLDEIEKGIYKYYIKRATEEVREAKGENDFCVSVFSDNSGAIKFDENYLITDKAETHNSPSALDPFGGAITGIVGVNRDTLGFGKGAKPVINRYGFCLGNPEDERDLYRGKDKKDKALKPKQILNGVVSGVNHGGNQSGIPSPQGFLYYEDRYRGKPLVFAGTVGLIPKEINGQPSHLKQAKKGDKIVIVGGRVGLDGIHGATFSSEAMDSGSPATAVQIGDPITQKKLSDAIVKEARDRGLYNSITDCGAGGISCSVSEMAQECGGCEVDLGKVLLKYPNLSPWEIWISESQERMTLSVPPAKLDEFLNLMERRGVEACVIGEFNDGDRCEVNYKGEKVMDLDMDFLHDGLPKEQQTTSYTKSKNPEPEIENKDNLNQVLLDMVQRNNLSSYEFVSMQYDHEVQAGSVIKPLQGKGRVNGSASVTKPLLTSNKGAVLSQAMTPRYGDVDMYDMVASSIDSAIRSAVAVGGNPDYLAIMDNFCWCSSDEPERLGQLKEAAKSCYENAVAFGTPFISGKDSMFNDFKGYDENNNPIKISIPPTLLVSSLGVIDDIKKAVSLDAKMEGDLVYVIGQTKNELGGSEYFHLHDAIGNNAPKVDPKQALARYRKVYQAVQKELLASAVSVEIGGLATAFAKTAIGGQLGLDLDLSKLDVDGLDRNDYTLFSESQSRLVVTIDPNNKEEFESIFGDDAQLIGQVGGDRVQIKGLGGGRVVDLSVEELEEGYKETFKNY